MVNTLRIGIIGTSLSASAFMRAGAGQSVPCSGRGSHVPMVTIAATRVMLKKTGAYPQGAAIES